MLQLGNYRLGGWIQAKDHDSTIFITEVPHPQLPVNPGGAGASEQENRHTKNAGCGQQELNLYMETRSAISVQALDSTPIIK